MSISDKSPISVLKVALNNIFGEVSWYEYEVETLLLEAGLPVTPLIREKLNLLKVLGHEPELFYKDHLFFLHATEVMNNNFTDFDFVPSPSSLEAAFAITDMALTGGYTLENSPSYSDGVISTITYCLRNEGFSKPVGPFEHVGITGLYPGQTEKDTADKLKAIKEYIYAMYNGSAS